MLYAVLALITALVALGSFYYFQHNGNTGLLIAAIVCVVLTLVFGGLFLSGRVNKTDDIHITE